jgi:hypothetical protein
VDEEEAADADLEGPSLVTALAWCPGNDTHTQSVPAHTVALLWQIYIPAELIYQDRSSDHCKTTPAVENSNTAQVQSVPEYTASMCVHCILHDAIRCEML